MNINNQPPEKADRREDGRVVVHSIFYTIQGEGPFAGEPAVFVRLAGCNLQCPACDTEYTSHRTLMRPEDVYSEVCVALVDWHGQAVGGDGMPGGNLVVITGGEPFRQNILGVVAYLLKEGFRVQIETNGSLYPGDAFPFHHPDLTIVCSPKTSNVHRKLVEHIAAFKYVATGESIQDDGLPQHALEHPNAGRLFRPPAGWRGTIYLQPVDEQNEAKNAYNRAAVMVACMKHGHRLCLQLHKIIGLD